MTYLRPTPSFAAFVAASLVTGAAVSAAQLLNPGQAAPALTYHLLNGRQLPSRALHGHPYILWMVASWCPSCQTGSNVFASHVDFLHAHGVRIVEMQLAHDLGQPGPGLQTFQKAVGTKASSPNWYWGELTEAQTSELDPSGNMDVYYLVNARGTIVAVNSSPAASWDVIQRFAEAK